MIKGFEYLSAKDYLGRVIIIGRDKSGRNEVVIYAITGRSPSSQERKLKHEDKTIWVIPLYEETLKKENIELLIYPAIFLSGGIAVSNGRQTIDIKKKFNQTQNPSDILCSALRRWNYEPDPPNYTARISGCILPQKKAALSIIKRAADGSTTKDIFDVPLKAGRGKMIATYSGENIDPLPAFSGEPIDVELKEKTAEDMAEAVYEILGPKINGKDYRVAVACVFSDNLESDEYDIFIINRYEREKNHHGKNKQTDTETVQD